MLTHVVFGAGATAALMEIQPLYVGAYVALVLSLIVNPVLDWLGHFRRGPYISRSPFTHSVFTAPVWGAAVAYLVWTALGPFGVLGVVSSTTLLAAGVVVALTHLILDSVTERGVFILGDRVALAHFRSGNPILNWTFVALGVALFLLYLFPSLSM